jgi:RNA polymerase sigma factor (TIGR02999 family)
MDADALDDARECAAGPTPGSEDALVQELLQRLRAGESEAREELFRIVASELHALAARQMRRQSPEHTLQATALVNEAYLKLFGRAPTACRDKTHLLRAAACAMRQVLQDHARLKQAGKRARPGKRVEISSGVGEPEDSSAASFLEFGEEVERLSRASPDMARAMEMRYILGFTMEEIAGILHKPLRTLEREFASASALLAARMR